MVQASVPDCAPYCGSLVLLHVTAARRYWVTATCTELMPCATQHDTDKEQDNDAGRQMQRLHAAKPEPALQHLNSQRQVAAC